MKVQRRSVSILFIAIFLLVGSATVFGCECSRRNDFDLEFALSKAVFSGEVVDIDNARPDANVTFRVDKIWKGTNGEKLVVKTSNQGKACGFVFTKGERYLVYAFGDGALRTSICTRTAPAGYASDDFRNLDDAGWSAPVNGLRARLSVLPSDKPDSPFCRVFIEMQNVGDVMGQKKIRFHPRGLDLKVTDITNGKPLSPPATVVYGGMSPLWEATLLPFAGSTKFQISFRGLGYRVTDRVIVDMGPTQSWIIPPDGSYVLSGRLVIPEQKGDHPHMDWSGTLELPAVRIPNVN